MGRAIKGHKRTGDESELHLVTSPNNVEDDAHRTVYLVGEINEESSAMISARLIHLSQLNGSPVRFIINTYGGSVDESLAIYDVIKSIRCPIHTVGFGKVMSAGVLLLAAGAPGHRYIGARTRVMIHNGHMGFEGDPWSVKNELAEFERLEDAWNKELLACSKLKTAQLNKMMNDRQNAYLTADEAIKNGIADAILGA